MILWFPKQIYEVITLRCSGKYWSIESLTVCTDSDKIRIIVPSYYEGFLMISAVAVVTRSNMKRRQNK